MCPSCCWWCSAWRASPCCCPFDAADAGLQLVEQARWVHAIGLDYALALDGLSLPLVLMNGVLCLVAAIASRTIENRPRVYFALLLVISGAVNGAFLAQNLLLFFLFYELELIPLWMLIAVWGGANRAYAATKFLIVTAVSGVLILGAFLGIAWSPAPWISACGRSWPVNWA